LGVRASAGSINKFLAGKYMDIEEDESPYYLASSLRLVASHKIPASS
jgi:hypothetical protein